MRRQSLALMAYGVAGPLCAYKGELELIEMDPLEDPWLLLWAGIEAAAGVKVGVLGLTLNKNFMESFNIRISEIHITGNQPPSIFSLTANPSLVTPGGTSTIKLWAYDPGR